MSSQEAPTPGKSTDARRRLLEELLKQEGVSVSTTPAIVRRPASASAPLSFAQERLWLLDQLEPGSHYNDHFHLRVSGPLDVTALERSFSEVAARHESLRTTFATRDGQPEQVVLPAAPVQLPITDLCNVPGPERLERARRLAVEKGDAPFNLRAGPLWRPELLRLSDEDHVLLFTAHHIVIDGWSRAVLLRELAALYEGFVSGRRPALPPLPIQYADFAAWQRAVPRESFAPHVEYWRAQLEGAPSLLELPADRPRPGSRDHRGARQAFGFGEGLTGRLKELSRKEGCTLFMALLAGFATLLHRYTEQTDLVVGTPVANRNRTEIEGLVGFFVNMLPLRCRLAGDPTFRGLMREVRSVVLEASTHQDLPFDELVREIQPVRAGNHSPIFQVLFILQNTPDPTARAGGLVFEPFEVDPGTAKFDLTVNLAETASEMEGWVEYATDLFDADRIARLVSHLERILEAGVAEPDTRISALPLMTEAERRQVLLEWNRTSRDYPREKCIQEVFEGQVDRTPNATALVCGAERLTYRQLDGRANQLARFLKKHGVGPDVTVGVHLDRSVEAIVAFLAILKAGG
ncbi:MAG TPA: condensation domain-containing protein, partial [Thermoanaerobaculia bacterium]|nr:condensation domain-containing protein [Thermoanaerobaculia bacterium]